MAKELDDLLRDVFGSGKSRTISTQRAETYLEQSRKMNAGLDALNKKQENLNQKLQDQLEELKKMSGELDFDAIQKEVEKDFGVTYQKKAPSKPEAAVKETDSRPEAQRFGDLLPKLTGTLIGQEAFLKKLVIAFKRPYIMGWEQPEGLRNAILVHGKPNTGRHTALDLVAEGMTEAGLLASGKVQTMDLALYPGQSEEKLFLQDLYAALLKGGILVLDHYEQCHPAFLQQLGELICTGSLQLASRYVMQKGHLVDAGTALASETVGCIHANGSYLVLVSEKGLDKLVGAFGAKVVDALGDVCATQPLTRESVEKIAALQYEKLAEKAAKRLGFTLAADASINAFLADKIKPDTGIGGILDYTNDCFEALAQYKLEKDAPEQTVSLICEDSHLFAVLDGVKTDLLSLLPGGYRGELEAVKAEMDNIVGLREIKEYILSLEKNYKVQEMRKAQGLPVSGVSMHMIFTGNPGTGKTTIARLVSKYLKAIGVLSGGQLVEVSRADLVGKYVGHTAPLTMQVIKSALGGVLFIDEAYSLYRGKDDSFGLEAIDTLVKGMEDNRDDLIVILAGYTREMETFLTANSGLQSRFPNIIEFPDYTGDELAKIAEINATSRGYRLSEEAKGALLDYFCVIQAMDDRSSGNGRLARNVIESAILAQSRRVLDQPEAQLDLLEKCDFDLFE